MINVGINAILRQGKIVKHQQIAIYFNYTCTHVPINARVIRLKRAHDLP